MKGQSLGNWIADREVRASPDSDERDPDALAALLRRRRRRRIVVALAACVFVAAVVLIIRRVSEYRRLVMNTFGGSITAIEFQPYPGKDFIRVEDPGQIQWLRQALADALPIEKYTLLTPCELRIIRDDGAIVTMKVGQSGPTSIGPNGAMTAATSMVDVEWGPHRRSVNTWALMNLYQQAPNPKPQPDLSTTNPSAPANAGTAQIRIWPGAPGMSSINPQDPTLHEHRERVEWLMKEKALGPAKFLLAHAIAQRPTDPAAELRTGLESSAGMRLTSLLAQLEIALQRDAPLDRAAYLRHRDELLEARWLASPTDARLLASAEKLKQRRPPLDLTKLVEIQTLKGEGTDFYPIRDLAWSPDNSRIAAACADGTLRLWDAQSGHLVLRLKTMPAHAVRFLPDNRHVMVGGGSPHGYSLAVFDLATGKETLASPQREPVIAMRLTADASRLLTAFPTDRPLVWNLGETPPKASDPFEVWKKRAGDAATSPDGMRIALMGDGPSRAVAIHDVRGGTTVEIGPIDWTCQAAFSQNGSRFIAAQLARPMQSWDSVTGKAIELTESGERVFSERFSPDHAVAIQPLGNRAILFEVGTGNPLAHLEHPSPVLDAAFSPDGDQILTRTLTSLHIWSNGF